MALNVKSKRPISVLETVIGVVILVIVAIIGTFLWRGSKTYDPDLYALNPAFLQEESVATRLTQNTLVAAQTLENLAKNPRFQAGELESFEPDNLWEKIDGKDGAFLTYGFERLDVMYYALTQAPELWFEAFIYDMGGAYNAFGVYASLHTGDETPWEHRGIKGAHSGNSVSFYTGRYYVTLIGSADQPALMKQIDAAAKELAGKLPTEPINLWAFDIFPTGGLIKGSIGYRFSNFLASDFFGDVFTARYEVDGAEMTAYLSKRENSEAAAKLFGKIQDFFKLMQAKVSDVERTADTVLFTADNYGLHEVVFQHGVWVGGVTEADDALKARTLTERLQQRLPE